MKKLAVIILSIWMFGCAKVYDPIAGREVRTLYSEAQEIQLGRQVAENIIREEEICEESSGFISRIGTRVAENSDRPGLPYTFKVVDSDQVNAFALPGGFIFMYRGLLDILDEDEVAAVLGHEVAHVVARHGIKRVQSVYGYQILSLAGLIAVSGRMEDPAKVQEIADGIFTLVLLGYSRRDELEADRLGTRYAHRAGYDPRGMLGVLEKLEEKQKGAAELYFLSTHPPVRDRMREVNIVISAIEAGSRREEAGDGKD